MVGDDGVPPVAMIAITTSFVELVVNVVATEEIVPPPLFRLCPSSASGIMDVVVEVEVVEVVVEVDMEPGSLEATIASA